MGQSTFTNEGEGQTADRLNEPTESDELCAVGSTFVNPDRWCFAWAADAANPSGAEKAALIRRSAWQPGDTISVSFLDGDPSMWNRVKQVAKRWIGAEMANLTFAFRTDTQRTDVRISFRQVGSWSVIGTTCKRLSDPSKPTMNLGLSSKMSEDAIWRTVLHEFGHVLGLIHEHQHPMGGISWNRRAVFADLKGPPHHWSKTKIRRNLFEPIATGEINGTIFDKDSIMLYPIPARWTTNGFSSGLNSGLSLGDRQLVVERYPH